MIVLKIILWVILAVLGIILLILIAPISAKVSFIGGKLSYMVKFAYIPIFGSERNGILNKIMKMKKNKKIPEKKDEVPFAEEDIPETDDDELLTKEAPSEVSGCVPDIDTMEIEKEESDNLADETIADDIISEESEPEKKRKKKSKEKPEKEPKTAVDKIEFILELWEAADRPVLKIFKGIKLSELYIDFLIANEDAYKCALNYGRISGAIYNLLGWLSVLFNVKLKTVDILPGFAMKKSQWDAAAKVSFSLITLVIAGIWFLIIYIFKVFILSRIKKN